MPYEEDFIHGCCEGCLTSLSPFIQGYCEGCLTALSPFLGGVYDKMSTDHEGYTQQTVSLFRVSTS